MVILDLIRKSSFLPNRPWNRITFKLSSDEAQLIPDVAADPSLPRTRQQLCPKCQHREAVFFQSRARRADTAMTLYYVCCNPQCGHRWVDPSALR